MMRSLKAKMFFVLCGFIVMIILLFYLSNALLLERYYTIRKIGFMTDTYERLRELQSEGGEAVEEEIDRLIYDRNLNIFIYPEVDKLKNKFPNLTDYLNSEQLQEKETIIKEQDSYTIRKIALGRISSEGLLFIGHLNNDRKVIMYIPVASIRASADILNELLAYIALFSIMAGTVLSLLMAGKITKPILRISRMSEKMKSLDFTNRYQGRRNDEIQVLGENMNSLSQILDHTLTELKEKNRLLSLDIHQKERNEKMRKQFLQNASHQLKTPIAIVKGYAEGLMDDVADNEESRIKYASTIFKEADKMDGLVMRILSLARLEADNSVLKPERFDIACLIKEMFIELSPLFEQHGIAPVYRGDAPIMVCADRNMIADVLSNYKYNAVQHVDAVKKIEVSASVDKDRVRIGVYNSGASIPVNEIAYIWQPFYKLEHPVGYKGTGLGLSIVAAVMKLHNKDFGIINRSGGVEFWFDLGVG